MDPRCGHWADGVFTNLPPRHEIMGHRVARLIGPPPTEAELNAIPVVGEVVAVGPPQPVANNPPLEDEVQE